MFRGSGFGPMRRVAGMRSSSHSSGRARRGTSHETNRSSLPVSLRLGHSSSKPRFLLLQAPPAPSWRSPPPPAPGTRRRPSPSSCSPSSVFPTAVLPLNIWPPLAHQARGLASGRHVRGDGGPLELTEASRIEEGEEGFDSIDKCTQRCLRSPPPPLVSSLALLFRACECLRASAGLPCSALHPYSISCVSVGTSDVTKRHWCDAIVAVWTWSVWAIS